MSTKSDNGNLRGTQVQVPKGPGSFIGKSFRTLVTAALNCVFNHKFLVPVYNSTGNYIGTKEAETVMGPKGAVTTFPQITAAAGTSGSASVQQFKIISDGGDYWVCKTWDGTTLGSTTVNVAKPFKLRAGVGKITSEVIRGVTYTYTYTAVTVGAVTGYYTRAVSGSDGSSETDYMIPDPRANDIIYGITFATTTPSSLAAVTWLDINADGRAWAK